MHTLFTGVTQSGKTTLARLNARACVKRNIPTVVYDPLGTATAGGGWGEGVTVYHDIEPFLELMYNPEFKDTMIYVDEAHHIFGHDNKEHLWLLTEGRHHGMNFNLITQRPTKLHPDARSNCGVCFMFRLAHDDARAVGNDFGHSDIHKIKLDKGDFLVLISGSAAYTSANVFKLT